MKYVYTLGPWKEYYGYVFFDGKPTEITDSATLERIQRESGFRAVSESQRAVPAVPAVLEVKPKVKENQDGEVEKGQGQAPTPVLKGKKCSKCHKLIPRGWYMHQKWCKGI